MEAERPVPSAAVLGAKAVRLEQICRESLASETALRVAVPALLSETQRARWQELERALQLLPALAEAQELNMNGRAPANALPPPFAAGLPPQRRYEWTTIFSGSQVLPGCDGGATTGGRWFGATPQIAPAVRSAEDAFAEGRMDGLKPVAR